VRRTISRSRQAAAVRDVQNGNRPCGAGSPLGVVATNPALAAVVAARTVLTVGSSREAGVPFAAATLRLARRTANENAFKVIWAPGRWFGRSKDGVRMSGSPGKGSTASTPAERPGIAQLPRTYLVAGVAHARYHRRQATVAYRVIAEHERGRRPRGATGVLAVPPSLNAPICPSAVEGPSLNDRVLQFCKCHVFLRRPPFAV